MYCINTPKTVLCHGIVVIVDSPVTVILSNTKEISLLQQGPIIISSCMYIVIHDKGDQNTLKYLDQARGNNNVLGYPYFFVTCTIIWLVLSCIRIQCGP